MNALQVNAIVDAVTSERCTELAVTLVDVDPSRAVVAAALGARFARPEDAAGGCDLVVHTSATAAGLQRSLDLLGTGIEMPVPRRHCGSPAAAIMRQRSASIRQS